MGCDIHAFIEYTKEAPEQTGERGWRSFGSKFHLSRHYGVFAKLAGVRNWPDWGIVPISKPRGLPDDAAYQACEYYWLYITPSAGERYCSKANAERWVAGGVSRYRDGERHFVSDPDAHSASWVSPDEWEAMLSDPKIQGVEDAYHAFLAAMRSLESKGNEVRAVFWFDN